MGSEVKIALLTPYTGGNLGDAAIQDAVIGNVRKRYPDAELCLVTLCPEATARLHKVPSFPIDARSSNQVEVLGATANYDVARLASTHAGLLDWAKATVERFPVIYSFLKLVQTGIIGCFNAVMLVAKEVRHIYKSYRLLKQVNLLLVSGGGQLDDYWGGAWAHPYALFKWGMIARLTGARYVFVSVGACSLRPGLGVFFIEHALGSASYRSYRDHTSKMLLKPLAVTHNDAVCPDLAFSYDLPTAANDTQRTHAETVVAVSPIAYLSRYGWPVEDAPIYERYFDELCVFIQELIRLGNLVILYSTDTCDRHVVADIVARLSKNKELEIEDRLSVAHCDTAADLLKELAHVDFVVASRLHGILLPNLLALPVLAISYDRKVDTYMNDMGMANYCLDIHKLEAESIMKAFQSLTLNSRDIIQNLANKKKDYARDLQTQFDLVLSQEADARR
jgi:polysaccharide pyruvyl transferase WcaK-like protein